MGGGGRTANYSAVRKQLSIHHCAIYYHETKEHSAARWIFFYANTFCEKKISAQTS